MAQLARISERRTIVDDIYDHLHAEISALRLKPGDRISEADIASQFGVSRQPVRDAFSRLANKDLLLIRPQRATEVRRFSMREIEKSRFVRSAVETEVLRCAANYCDEIGAAKLDAELEKQAHTMAAGDFDSFGALDYAFHKTLCEIAKADFAFDIILAEKPKVDRLCLLGLVREDHMPELVDDHTAIALAVKSNDPLKAIEAGARHLSRLDETITRISATNANYFEPV